MSATNKRKVKTTPLKERLLAKKTVTESGCWEFNGWRNNKGYGLIGSENDRFANGKLKLVLAHRASYSIFKGEIPEKNIVCHTCDNPPCFNPDHLFVGTHKDNFKDMWDKGRANVLRGEQAPNSILSDDQVAEIRRRYVPPIQKGRGYTSNSAELAKEFGITKQYVIQIVTRKWRRV